MAQGPRGLRWVAALTPFWWRHRKDGDPVAWPRCCASSPVLSGEAPPRWREGQNLRRLEALPVRLG